MPGTLYVVATPIGNLEDITLRALSVLKAVDVIYCEDTRHSLKLLSHYGISKPLVSLHEHNERERIPSALHKLEAGESAAVITDAGTPLLSDPGARLVAAAREAGMPVTPIPGPSAPVAALSAAGMDTSNGFLFAGFLPEKASERDALLSRLDPLPFLLVFFVPPHDARKRLKQLSERWPQRRACLCRELTKVHEEFGRGTLAELYERTMKREPVGEITLLVEGQAQVEADTRDVDDVELRAMIEDALRGSAELRGMGTKELSKTLSRMFNIPARRMYDAVLKATEKEAE